MWIGAGVRTLARRRSPATRADSPGAWSCPSAGWSWWPTRTYGTVSPVCCGMSVHCVLLFLLLDYMGRGAFCSGLCSRWWSSRDCSHGPCVRARTSPLPTRPAEPLAAAATSLSCSRKRSHGSTLSAAARTAATRSSRRLATRGDEEAVFWCRYRLRSLSQDARVARGVTNWRTHPAPSVS
jgi:hypothetical protein